MPSKELLTVADKSPNYPRILIGTLEERFISVPGKAGTTHVYGATCERCGTEVTRATSAESARKDLLHHRQGCRPRLHGKRAGKEQNEGGQPKASS